MFFISFQKLFFFVLHFCLDIFGHVGKLLDKKGKVKVRLSPSKKLFCFNKSPLKMMKNAYFILKAPFILMIVKFLC